MEERIKEILDIPKEGETYDSYMDVHLLDGEFMCYHMTEEGKTKLAKAILTAVAESVPPKKNIEGAEVYSHNWSSQQGYNEAIDEVLAQLGKEK